MSAENRLIVFVDNTGRRSYKNLREAERLIASGSGHIEGQTKTVEHEDAKPIVKQTKKKNK